MNSYYYSPESGLDHFDPSLSGRIARQAYCQRRMTGSVIDFRRTRWLPGAMRLMIGATQDDRLQRLNIVGTAPQTLESPAR